jgi:hypothetical protein
MILRISLNFQRKRMFSSQDNEFARNTHVTARSENRVFLKIQYFKKETFVRVETFRIFYGP